MSISHAARSQRFAGTINTRRAHPLDRPTDWELRAMLMRITAIVIVGGFAIGALCACVS